MAVPSSFQPFVPASESRPEFTFRALALGAVFAVLFGAVTVYVGLRAGLTVAASIPISVLSISILRAFGASSILENNIVQTIGNAGQSIAAGVIFTLPALIFLGFDLESTRIFALALFGGWLGVLFMIPLRRQLIVEEHGTLVYPEGTACADVLMAGERGGSSASRVFLGLGLGAIYTLFQNENLFSLWPSGPDYQPDFGGSQHILKGSAIRADCTPEYLGVGYIIGIRVASILLAGGVFSWLVLMPAIYFFGSHLSGPLYPGTVPIASMSPSDLWRTYVRPMGAGAVAAAGLITLLRTAPTIVSALTQGVKQMRTRSDADHASEPAVMLRTAHDLPMSVVLGGVVAAGCTDGCVSPISPGTGSAGWPACKHRGRVAGRGLWIPVCHGFGAHRRHCGLKRESGLGDDDRHPHGDDGHLPGAGLDGPGLRRACNHHRRHRVHRGLERGRHLAGSQDRLSHRRDPVEAAGRGDGRCDHLRLFNRGHAERDEQGPGELSACACADRGHLATPRRRRPG